ncbi:MAG TPA: 6-bladed beta-propeller [Bacteroidales bacterium]|nr:6-bladed beta-propeller [Bacteroidales bacterium]
MKPILSIFFVSIILISCNKHSNENQPETPTLKFDLDFSPVKTLSKDYALSLNELADSISFVKLETGKDFLIKNISWIEQFNNLLYIIDKELNQLFVFDMNGRFKFQLVTKGKGPTDILDLTDFTIDRNNNLVYIWDNALRKIIIFDAKNDAYLDQFKIDGVCHSFLSYGKDSFLVYTGLRPNKGINSDLEHNVFMMTKDGKIINKYLPIDKYQAYMGVGYVKFSSYNDLPLIVPDYTNTVYQINKDRCSPRYYLDFGKNNFPQDLFKEYNKEPDNLKARLNCQTKLFQDIIRKGKYVHSINKYLETDNVIYFNFFCNEEYFCLLYNKKNKTHLLRRGIKLYLDNALIAMYPTLFKIERNCLISFTTSSLLRDCFKDKNITNLKYKELYEKTSPTDNPILFIMHLKNK